MAERTEGPRLWLAVARPPALMAERTERPRLWLAVARPPALMLVLIVRPVFVVLVEVVIFVLRGSLSRLQLTCQRDSHGNRGVRARALALAHIEVLRQGAVVRRLRALVI